MLEYMTYKKVKKHKAEKAAQEDAANRDESSASTSRRAHSEEQVRPGAPVLNPEDEAFLERLLSDEGPRPPLPPRMKTPDVDWTSDLDASSTFGPSRSEAEHIKDRKGKGKEDAKPGRLSMLISRVRGGDKLDRDDLPPSELVKEEKRESNDVGRILDRLNLSTKNNKVIPTSAESSDLLNRFTLVFKDLANGVPTAYGDLVKLIEDREGTLNKGFNKLPKSLQKLVMQLPEKVTGALGPEVLLAAASAQGIHAEKGSSMKDQAGKIFVPKNIMQLVTKPGAVIGMLKAIVNALRVRWPAFIGMNVIWSVALFLLMFVLWYCYKRGREVRLEQDKLGEPVDGSDRIEELPDDPMLPAPPSRRATNRSIASAPYSSSEEERPRRRDDRDRPQDDSRDRRHEDRRDRRHDDDEWAQRDNEMSRREQRMMKREAELARREEELARRDSSRRHR